jgi:uncharacterized membrane protein
MSLSDISGGEGKVLNELEVKIDDLERQNFDLKMQVYYLTQNAGSSSNNTGESCYSLYL